VRDLKTGESDPVNVYVSPAVSPEPKRARSDRQLPPGRHGLERSFVVTNQRERMLDAVADVVSLSGYADMRVEDIIATAGVSRRTFYDHFPNKEDAFLAAYDAIVSRLLQQMGEAYDRDPTFVGKVINCLTTFLEFVASEPAFADMCIVEVMAAGPKAIERRNIAMKAIGALIQTAANYDLPKQQPALTAETIVGGIYEVVYSRILQGETHLLGDLVPELAYSIMLPYIGHDAAVAEMRKLEKQRNRKSSAEPEQPAA